MDAAGGMRSESGDWLASESRSRSCIRMHALVEVVASLDYTANSGMGYGYSAREIAEAIKSIQGD